MVRQTGKAPQRPNAPPPTPPRQLLHAMPAQSELARGRLPAAAPRSATFALEPYARREVVRASSVPPTRHRLRRLARVPPPRPRSLAGPPRVVHAPVGEEPALGLGQRRARRRAQPPLVRVEQVAASASTRPPNVLDMPAGQFPPAGTR